MKTRSIVSAIVAAALSVVLCVGLLVGTTVAADTVWAGFVMLQDFGSEQEPQLFTGFTLNFSGNTADGAALQNNSWYTAANDRAFYVYENAYADANGGKLNPDTENLPTVSMN